MMIRMRFSAQELYEMADAAGKSKMYGLPDAFDWLPDEEVPKARQAVSDRLLEEGILTMDFDGVLGVAPDYSELVDVYCGCQKCLTVNRQEADGSYDNRIFWRHNGQFWRAECIEDDYVFRSADKAEVDAELSMDEWKCSSSEEGAGIIIPQIALKKAKRYAMNHDMEEAARILKQNGADDRTLSVLCDGLQEKARYLGLLLMDMRSGECRKTESAWLGSRGILFSMKATTSNFRSCLAFIETTPEKVSQEKDQIISAFLEEE